MPSVPAAGWRSYCSLSFFFFLFTVTCGTDNLSKSKHQPSHGRDHVGLEWAGTSSLKPFLTWDNKLTVAIQDVLYPEVGMEFSTPGFLVCQEVPAAAYWARSAQNLEKVRENLLNF